MPFPITNWTLLAQATAQGNDEGRRALETMCGAYRKPVLLFLVSRGHPMQEAEDLTQEFFLRWLRHRSWKNADPARGRFRTFLLGSLRHMLANHLAHKNALKRGGGAQVDSLDDLMANGVELAVQEGTQDDVFDRAWGIALVDNTLAALKIEYEGRGRAKAFEILRRFLPQGGELISLEAAAESLGSNPSAVKAAVHRLRERFRELLRGTVAATVSAPHEVDAELIYLRSMLARGGHERPMDEQRAALSANAVAPSRHLAPENRNTP